MTFPPGPRQPMLVQSMRMQREPLTFLRGMQDRYGDYFTLNMMAVGKVVATGHPDAVEQVLADEDGFPGGEAQQMVEPLVGPRSIFVSEGEDHTRKRRIMFKPFHRTAVARYGERVRRIVHDELDTWSMGEPIAMRPRMQRIAMDVILQLVFGVEDPERLQAFRDRLGAMREQANLVVMFPPLQRDLGRWSPWSRFERRRAAVDELVHAEITARRADPRLGSRDDILSLLLSAEDEAGDGFTDSEVRDQLFSMVVAGHETTATSLAWSMDLLARHPEAVERIRGELDAAETPYLDAVIDESLRLYPPIFHVARKSSRPFELGGHALPAGTWVMVAILLAHRRPDVYADPDVFRPERFLTGEPRPRFAFVPFAAGGRRCLGMHLARLEMRVTLQEVARRMEVAPARSEPETPTLFHVTMVPKHGSTVVLRDRVAEPA